jgi:hypothetical protein
MKSQQNQRMESRSIIKSTKELSNDLQMWVNPQPR